MAADQTKDSLTLSPYERHVKQALRLLRRPERLGEESPLASAYFLGRMLRDRPRPLSARDRGEVLAAVIHEAASKLWRGTPPASRDEMLAAILAVRNDPDDPRYAYVVLELRCFHDHIEPARTSDIWEQPHLLPGSKSQHYRDFDAAVKRLATLLLESLRPALRREQPRPPAVLYGYEQQLAQVTAALAAGQTVALMGPGGAGKTSIAATAVASLAPQPVFWYTLRPDFNDNVTSLIFALGAFLYEQGSANLWQYLVTTNGAIDDLNLALGLLRQDLAQCSARAPILCFDDLEHLYSANLALASPAHTRVLELIDGLRGPTPLLLISQRSLPTSDMQLEVNGLAIEDVARLWRAAGHDLSASDAELLHAYTTGNPRLLLLMLTLQQQFGNMLQEIAAGHAARSLLPAFQRLWQRLQPAERRTLQRLAVYRGYAPEDVADPAALSSLSQLRLVEYDGEGGVAVLPALAPVVYDDLSPELREGLHREAALALLERGEHTPAAYHFWRGGQEKRAVQSWFPQRRQAIARGEADAARPIFNQIARQRLDPAERKALDIIHAELHQLAGAGAEGLRALEQTDWSEESEATARLLMLRGELYEALGYPDQALVSFAEGLRVTARLAAQLAALRQRRGLLFLRRRDLAASWQEVRHAEYELQQLRGMLREEEGDYQAALEAFQSASDLADQLDDDALRAQAEQQIAAVYGRRQQLDAALTHGMRALAIYERLGDRVRLEKMRSNLAFIYVQTGQFQAALDVGASAYSFFVATHNPYLAAATGANLAEASYELGDYAGAARYAAEVLKLGDRHAAPYARYTLGQIDLARHTPAAALSNFHESLQAAIDNDDPYMVAYARRGMGQAYLANADHDSAADQLTTALELFRQLDIPNEVSATEHLLSASTIDQ